MRGNAAALRARGLIAAALSMTLVSWSHAASFYEEQNQLIRASRSVSALGPNLFGDKVNLYTGTLEFVQGDLSLPGNNALFVGVSRRLATGPNARLLQGNFGGWDLEIPRLQGVFSKTKGWMSNLGTSFTNQRCSQFASPGMVKGGNNDGYFDAQEYWRGHMLYDPATGEQEILTRSPGSPPGPTDGNSYPLLTKGHWALRCGVTLDSRNAFYQGSINDQGEGFWAVSPDGVSYRFDWLVHRGADLLQRSGPVSPGFSPPPGPTAAAGSASGSTTPGNDGLTALAAISYNLQRDEVWILPTLARDRNGNTVTYSYDPAKPWRLMTVSSSDSRTLSFSYDGDSNRVSSVTDGTRTVYYSYLNGELSAVTYADGSQMLLSSGLPLGSTPRFLTPPQCDVTKSGTPQDDVGQLTFTHPSGATGTFTVQSIGHARSYVPFACVGAVTPTKPVVSTPYPLYFATRSLVGKSITGPGLATQSWTYSYSAAANQASWSDCTGSCPATKTVQVVESSGNQSRQTLVFGNRVDVDEGKLLSQSEGSAAAPQMRVTTFAYQTGQLLGYSLQPLGDNTTARRNDRTRLRHIVQSGATFKWEATAFDATWDRPTTVTRSGPGGSVTEVTAYEDRLTPYVIGQVGTVTATSVAGQPVIVRHQYDGLGRLTSTASFGVTQFTQDYYGDGTLAWRADGAGRRTNYSSYWRGLPQTIGYPDGASETAAVNNLGLVTSLTNAAGYTTGYGYDAVGRLSSIAPPSGWTPTYLTFERVSSPEYGIPANHWRQTISQGNARTVSYFDGFWRPLMTRVFDTTLEASTRKVVVKGYDASGQLAFESYPQRDAGSVGITTPGKRLYYDALGRLSRTEADSELGVLNSSQAYLDGFQIQFTNPRGKVSTQSFWALDKPGEAQLASQSLPEGVTVSISRDAFGKPTAISRGGVTRRYVYDAGLRLCKTIEPEINATIQDYDAAGNVLWRAPGQALTGTSSCDTSAVAGTAKISYGYDPMNRLTTTTYGDNSPGITRTYWPDGMLKTVDSNGSTWSYVYNSLRLINTETLSYAGQGWTFSWGYSPNGHLASLSYPTGGPGVSYVPNALGEPSQIGSFATGLSFYPNGAVNSFRFGNGILHNLGQNLRGLPESNQDAGVLNDFYVYDANGNVNSISDRQENVFSRSMGYDDLDRLKTVSAPGVWGSATYTYDAADNLRTANVGSRNVTLNYLDGTNRLNRVDVNGTQQLYDYDPYGNIKRKGAQQYVFDQGNRLQSAVPGGSYVYDGLGRRIKVSSSDGSTRLSVYSQAGQLLWSTQAGTVPATVKGYKCPPGTMLKDGQCLGTGSEPATLKYSCPDASWTLTGQTCSKTETVEQPAGQTYQCTEGSLSGSTCLVTRTQAAIPVMGCAAGTTPSGSQCQQEVPDDYLATRSQGCDAGWTPQGDSCQKTVTSPAQSALDCAGQGPLEAYAEGLDGQACGGKKVLGVALGVASNECAKGASQSGLTLLKVRYDGVADDLVARALPANNGNWTCLYQPVRRLSCSAGSLQGDQCVQTQTVPAKTVYSCPSGGTPDGTMCRRKKTVLTGQVEVGKRCDADWMLQGSLCTRQVTVDAQKVYGCADGSTPVNGMCRISRPMSQSATSGYGCRPDWTLSGQTCTGPTSQPATPEYGCSSGTLSGSQCLGASQGTAYVQLGGKLIAEAVVGGTTQYVHTDALGSPVARTGPTGSLISRTRYEPYGYVAAGAKPSPSTSQVGFTGHVQDAETELVYMQQRYYDPIAGRFLSVDPIVTDANTGGGFGLYTYVNNNPYGSTDPDGRLSVASRTIIWPLVKQIRVCLVPIFHGLHRRTALER